MRTIIGKKKKKNLQLLNRACKLRLFNEINKARKKNMLTDHDAKKRCYKEKFRLGSGPLSTLSLILAVSFSLVILSQFTFI